MTFALLVYVISKYIPPGLLMVVVFDIGREEFPITIIKLVDLILLEQKT